MSTYEKLKNLLVTWLDVDEGQIAPEASLIDDLHADSLSLVELVMSMEDEFNLRIPSEDIQRIDTVQDAQEYLERRLTTS